MPQMSPMYWLVLMFYFIIMFILMITYMYFTILIKPNFFMEKMSTSKTDWAWQQIYFHLLILQQVLYQ